MLSKLRAVLTRSFAADLLGSARSTFDMTNVLDGGLLARLPKGLIGEDMARLAGSLIVARARQAALAPADIPEHARRDASLYVDECHNFAHLPSALEDILAEARPPAVPGAGRQRPQQGVLHPRTHRRACHGRPDGAGAYRHRTGPPEPVPGRLPAYRR